MRMLPNINDDIEGLNSGKTCGVRIKLWKKPSGTCSLLWPTKMDGWQRLGRRLGKGVAGALVFLDISTIGS